MEKKLVSVTGKSMFPYLRDGDSLLVQLETSVPVVGQLYLLNCDNRLIVHRYVGAGKFKGDRVKQSDNEIYQNVDNLGVICGRVGSKKIISFDTSIHSFFNQVFAYCSVQNKWNNYLIAKFNVLMIFLMGSFLRGLEQYGKSKYHQ